MDNCNKPSFSCCYLIAQLQQTKEVLTERVKQSEFVPRGCCLINRVMSGAGSLLGYSSFAAVHPWGRLIEYKHSSVILRSSDITVYQQPEVNRSCWSFFWKNAFILKAFFFKETGTVVCWNLCLKSLSRDHRPLIYTSLSFAYTLSSEPTIGLRSLLNMRSPVGAYRPWTLSATRPDLDNINLT